ncbi:hypothetical protein [Caulobacter sp.]|uniref:hypothetical protein n=1 Tax=Caulobacter sp. TaxID=78 RepID=UPI003BAB9454
MTDEEIIQEIKENDIIITGDVIRDPNRDGILLIFVEINRDIENKQRPSNALLRKISENLLSKDVNVDFILVDRTKNDIEAGARASLIHSFGDLIRNSFLSMTDKTVSVWIDVKRDITSEEANKIRGKMKLYFDSFELNFLDIFLTKRENTPAKLACLRNLRTISPASVKDLSEKLAKSGFIVPSETWLSHRLDSLRKSNLVLRLKSGAYAVTQQGLSLLGTQKNSRSPDITRLLDLARRGD